ncbi:MAG: hypothetical protein MUE88_11260 [Flavobacteriales bacterium]|nr:hypothetical protein [Flavobacteriales bacterium]
MGTVGYYLALPFIYGIALLPFPLLYLLSDGVYWLLFRVIGYRRQVVLTNLRNSFPERTEAEIQAIADRFFRWFCDLTLETLKTLTIGPEAVRERVAFRNIELLQRYAREGRSVILVLGHYGNWELAGARYSQEKDIPQLYVDGHSLHRGPDAVAGAGLLDDLSGAGHAGVLGNRSVGQKIGPAGDLHQHHPPEAWLLLHGDGATGRGTFHL